MSDHRREQLSEEGSPAAGGDTTTAVLRLQGLVPNRVEATKLAGQAMVDVLRRLDEMASVSFRVGSRAGVLHAGIVVTSFDAESAMSAASRLGAALDALTPWIEFEAGVLGEGDPLALPVRAEWASRVRKSEVSDEMVRAGDYSPLANALATLDAVLSVTVSRQPMSGAGLVSDIIVASADGPTDVPAALLTAELSGDANLDIETTHGPAADLLVESHSRPMEPLELATFADIFALPMRADGEAAWLRYPARPSSPADVIGSLRADAGLHRWVLGRTGTGKTTLLQHLIAADIDEGKTVVVIDPHGGLAETVVDGVPSDHFGRLVYADFGDANPPTLNPLIGEPGQDAASVTAELVEIVRNLWDDLTTELFGPVAERVLRFATESLVRYGPAPGIAKLTKVLQGDHDSLVALAQAASDAGDTAVADGFLTEINNLGSKANDGAAATMSLYVISKLAAMVNDARVRAIVDGPYANLSMSEVITTNQILVVRAPVGLLNLAGVRTICQLVVSRLASTLGRRFEEHGQRDQPVAVYIDEWPLVAEPPIQRILAEGRKFGFELTLANQSVRQIRQPSQVAGNVGTLGLFRVGPAEADLFAPEFSQISASGLRTMPPYHLAVRTAAGQEIVGQAPAPAGP